MDRLNIGCHLSSTKGYLGMATLITSLGGNTFQFFTRNPQGGSKAKDLDIEDIKKFNEYSKEHDFSYIIAHAPYTMNLAGLDNVREFGIRIMKDDLDRLSQVRNVYYNFHPGSHVGQGEEEGIKRIIDALNEVVEDNNGPMILLETMAGKGSEIGRNFVEIRNILNGVNIKERFGVTLDTCHIFDGGYDIKNSLEKVLQEFDEVIGLNNLKAIHLNDSLNELSSHKDRHALLGQGKIGLEAIIKIINEPKLKGLPFVLETPNDIEGYGKEIKLLKENYHAEILCR